MTTVLSKAPVAVAVAVVAVAALIPLLPRITPTSEGPVGLCPHSLPPTNPHHSDASGRSSSGNDSSSVVVVETERLGTIRAEPCRSFSESYYEARDKFLRAAESVPGTEVTSIEVTRSGDDVYYMDAAVLRGGGGDASKSESGSDSERGGGGLVVHTSGVHGVEGYAGSAIQVEALRHLSSLDEESRARLLGPSTTLVFVHAVNPFGMATYRRFNENNVDLNRNALDDGGWAEVLARDPNVANYDDFDEALLNPRRSPSALDAALLFWIKAVYAIVRNGYLNMKRCMVAGQYHNPRGIFFGGRELQASHRLLRDFLVGKGFAAGELGGGTVTWIDVHTGLGPRGLDTLLARGAPEDDPADYFRDTPLPILRGLNKNEPEKKTLDVGSGYDLSRGIMEDFYPGVLAPSQERAERASGGKKAPMIVTQEFGTVSSVLVARALILENMAYHHSGSAEHAQWAEYTRDAFYVRSDDWRRSVLTRGLTVLSQAVSRSSS